MVYLELTIIITLFIGCVAAQALVYRNIKLMPAMTPEQQSQQAEQAAKNIGYWLSLSFKDRQYEKQLIAAEQQFSQLTGDYVPQVAKNIFTPRRQIRPRPVAKTAKILAFSSNKASTKPPPNKNDHNK